MLSQEPCHPSHHIHLIKYTQKLETCINIWRQYMHNQTKKRTTIHQTSSNHVPNSKNTQPISPLQTFQSPSLLPNKKPFSLPTPTLDIQVTKDRRLAWALPNDDTLISTNRLAHNIMEKESFIVLLSIFLLITTASAQLSQNFYKNICPNVESLVRSAVLKKFQQTFVTAPATLRLFFHDCFVRGCDASVLLASPINNAEKDHPDDISLAGDGFDTVTKAKTAVDGDPRCRNRVSCADILAIAARDVVVLTGGPYFPVELGRRDGRISTSAAVQNRLPHPEFNLDQLNAMFNPHGLTQTDMIALSGAHTIGFSHCSRFSRRIYRFSPTSRIDPTLNKQYALGLRQMCPINVDPRVAINMDPTTPLRFDNAYFQNLQQGKGLFTSDQVLFTDLRSRPTVNLFASNNGAFYQAFVTAFTKLGRVGVLTGFQGEIRRDCTRVN